MGFSSLFLVIPIDATDFHGIIKGASSLFRPRRSQPMRSAGFFCWHPEESPRMWRFDKHRAILDSPSFTFEIDTQSPESGAGCLKLAGAEWQGANPLQIHTFDPSVMGQPKCENIYLRGPDLVLSYRMSRVPELSWQVYWRALASEEEMFDGVELILSVQTDLLETSPRLMIESQLATSQLLQLKFDESARPVELVHSSSNEATWVEIAGTPPSARVDPPGLLLYRPSGAAHSYLEMIHPSDFAGLEVSWNTSDPPQSTARFLLFDEPLEKGVIRRGRLRTMVLPRADDLATAQACYRCFAESAIPLTT
jgi:hypothetical protein